MNFSRMACERRSLTKGGAAFASEGSLFLVYGRDVGFKERFSAEMRTALGAFERSDFRVHHSHVTISIGASSEAGGALGATIGTNTRG